MAFVRISIEGSLGASPEVFSTGFAAQMVDRLPTEAEAVEWANAVLEALRGTESAGADWFREQLGTVSSITRVRIYGYATPGAPASVFGVSTGALVQGEGSVTHPPQLATVVSLLTGLPGASRRGRMYIPWLTGSVNSSLKRTGLSVSTAQNFAGLLRGMTNLTPAGLAADPAVVSASQGLVTLVTSVRIGDVVDTQRRRRDTLVENYVGAPLPPP